METIQTKVNRSLALTNDAHLSKFHSQIEVFENCVKFKQYAYIDFDVVSGGAIFFFVPFNSYMSENWDCKDTLEIFVEFTTQPLYKESYSPKRGIHKSNEFRLIDNDNEKFDMVKGLMEAELKAFEYINNK
ncbi:hypothetical protein [Sphingobacterium multivorum]|uniref:hypothetical protein n=1 Tax=Sphingobacterium multivorum TaxID=28454 RepID=UPI003DA2B917